MTSTYEKNMANWNSTKSTKAADIKPGDRILNGRSNGFRTVTKVEPRGRMVAVFTGCPRPMVVASKAYFRVAV